MTGTVKSLPEGYGVQADARKLRASAGRVLNFFHRDRSILVSKRISEMTAMDIVIEAVEFGNPRGINRKLMKRLRKGYRALRKIKRKLERTHANVSALT